MRARLLTALAVLGPIALVSCGAPSTSDFVQTAAMSDMYEVEAGKIAGQKGQSDAVTRAERDRAAAEHQGRLADQARREASEHDR